MEKWIQSLAIWLIMIFSACISSAQDTPAGCSPEAEAIAIGRSDLTITSSDVERRFLIFVPESYDPTQPTPLVFSFHGYTSNADEQLFVTQFHALGEEEGFITIYPQGSGIIPRWFAGDVESNIDDVQFFRDMLDTVSTRLCVDTDRVFAAGWSNGGGMSHRLACEASDLVAAIGVVAPAINLADDNCTPDKAIPVIAFHGTEDEIVPYLGGDGIFNLPVTQDLPRITDWIASWSERNNCTNADQYTESSSIERTIYDECDESAEVILYTIIEGGHTWAGSVNFDEIPSAPLLGYVSMDVDATALMWEFFQNITDEDL